MSPEDPHGIASAVNEVSERATALVREEIELAKAEVAAKAKTLATGAAVALAAGVFALVGLLFLLIGIAYLFFDFVFLGQISFGFLIMAGVLFALGGLGGFLAYKAVKRASSPKPEMAIEEARKIRATFASPDGRS